MRTTVWAVLDRVAAGVRRVVDEEALPPAVREQLVAEPRSLRQLASRRPVAVTPPTLSDVDGTEPVLLLRKAMRELAEDIRTARQRAADNRPAGDVVAGTGLSPAPTGDLAERRVIAAFDHLDQLVLALARPVGPRPGP